MTYDHTIDIIECVSSNIIFSITNKDFLSGRNYILSYHRDYRLEITGHELWPSVVVLRPAKGIVGIIDILLSSDQEPHGYLNYLPYDVDTSLISILAIPDEGHQRFFDRLVNIYNLSLSPSDCRKRGSSGTSKSINFYYIMV